MATKKAEEGQTPEEARAAEADAVAAQVAQEEEAAEKRAEQAAAAANLKANQGEALPPTQKSVGGVTAYAMDRLISEGEGLLGYEPHVVAGAMHGVDKEYLTVDQAKARVERWLDSPADPVAAVEG